MTNQNPTALTPTLPSDHDNAELQSLTPWVSTWQTQDPVEIPLARIDAALRAARHQCVPADTRVLAVAIERLMGFAQAFRLPEPDQAVAIEIYRDTLAELPTDLLATAIRRTIAGYRWGNRLPLPGEVLATVAEDWAARRTVALRLDTALRRAQRDYRPPPAAAEVSEADRQAALAAVRAALAGATKPVPADRVTDAPEPTRSPYRPDVLAELAALRERNTTATAGNLPAGA